MQGSHRQFRCQRTGLVVQRDLNVVYMDFAIIRYRGSGCSVDDDSLEPVILRSM